MSVQYKDENGILQKGAGLYKSEVPIGIADIYTEGERQVGVFTDGKPVYQKTIYFEGTIPRNEWVDHNIANVDKIWVFDSVAKRNADYRYNGINYFASDDYLASAVNRTQIYISYSTSTVMTEGYITLRYTKTTDTATGVLPKSASALYLLGDVEISNLQNGDVLKYDDDDNKWKNGVGGGGGNANIWTGTQAELEEVFDELEEGTQINITDDEQEVVEGGTIYSEEEQVIGLWKNNKPLYQKTFVTEKTNIVGNSDIDITSDIDAISIDEIIAYNNHLLYTYTSGGSTVTGEYWSDDLARLAVVSNGYVIRLTIGGATLNTVKVTWTITYTKSTDAPIDVVVGKSTMYIASSDCYSTEEKEVGCWQDGKPLYQKTINFGALPNNTIKEVAHNISDIDFVADICAMIKQPTSEMYQRLPIVHTSMLNQQVQVWVTKTNIDVRSAVDYSAWTDCYITLRYTKTTDTAGSGEYTPASGKAVHYSTDEQVIGTWIDGKTLYRKVLPTITFNNNYEYTHNLGVKYYINVGGNCTVNNGTNPLPFPFLQSRYNGYCNFQNTTPNSVTLDSSWNNNNVDCYIEYTKLSDYS